MFIYSFKIFSLSNKIIILMIFSNKKNTVLREYIDKIAYGR